MPADCGCGPAWTDAAPQALEEGSSPLVPYPKGERASVLTCTVDALTAPDETEPMAAKAEPASEAFALPKRP